jgi:sugar phosphate isomerase/epimerase
MTAADTSAPVPRLRFGCCGCMIAPAADPIGIEIVETLAALGYDYIELSLRDLVALCPAALDALATRLQRAGLACEACNNFFPPEIRLTGPAADFSSALRYAERAFAVASRLGVRTIVFGSSGARNLPAGFPVDAGWAQLRTLLGALGPLAETHGLTLVLEPLNQGEANILHTVAEGWRLAQEVAHPRVRLLADSFHVLLENEDPAILISAAATLGHIHVAEGAARVFPSGGDASLRHFFAALLASGYTGRVSIEALTRDFPADAAQALRICRELTTAPSFTVHPSAP